MEEDKETENDGMLLYHGSSIGLMSGSRCSMGVPGGNITCLQSNNQETEELVFKIWVFPTNLSPYFHPHPLKCLTKIDTLCVCVCVCVYVLSRVRLFATPWTIALQASLSMEFSRQEYWSGLFPPPGDLPWIKPKSPALQADSSPLRYSNPYY